MITEEKKSVLELPGDCIDPRGFSSEQVMLRMEAFLGKYGFTHEP